MDKTFMTALHIYNVRHLKDIEIPLSENQSKSLILTGKNGSGKTSVLLALKEFMKYLVGEASDIEKEQNLRILEYYKKLVEKDHSNIENKKTELEEDEKGECIEKKLQRWKDGAVAEYTSYADMCEKYRRGEYVLAYYGDHRKINVEVSKNIEKVDLKDVYDMEDQPSRQLVKYLVNLKTTEAFAQTNNNPQRAEEIKSWFARFENILKDIYNDDSLTLNFDIETFEFTISQRGREPFDFNTMSMGYAAVFDIIGDLMMRMEKHRNYDLEGLVLIDEIETHLHVELQKKIVPILMKLFPNIQFVLTTHSPFILNSTPNAVVYDLENAITAQNGLTNLPYEGIVEGYFKVDLLSQELREKFDEYKKLVTKESISDADYARAAELEMYLDEVPDYLALDFATEYSRLKLEFSERG